MNYNEETDDRVTAAIKFIDLPAIYVDKNLIVRFINKAASDDFELQPEKVEGKLLTRNLLQKKLNSGNVVEEFRKVLVDGITFNSENESSIISLSGNTKTYFAVKSPVYDNDHEINGCLGIWSDITDYKLNQEMKKMEEQRKILQLQQREFKQYIEQFVYDLQYSALNLMQSHLKMDLKKFDAEDLAPHQYKILYLLAQGKTPDEITQELGGNCTSESVTLNIISIVNNALSRVGAAWGQDKLSLVN